MTDEFRTHNSVSGEVGANSAVVQLHHVGGDVLFMTNPKQTAHAVRTRPDASTMEQVMLAATALAAVMLLGWRYFLRASQRRAS
ncbi:hypothetical protein SAMN05216553_105451 [Lentzea fradiae]|uniref:Uncharacterized protein n=1 Tax=Lentzea fradiae TaxID=200378 RepID=A0A1G7RNX1_9PSEU|nr:hypothetical protein [Lentzea fradiae]SDG12425.1 hypothetical protein SAMN05216553_105451 [Lentzea fradiae]